MNTQRNKKSILESHWYRASLSWLTLLLLPFSWLFRCIVFLRYFLYRFHFKKTVQFPVPVIVVGNISVGGTGKTPFVIWLAQFLQTQGYRPGIVSRGVGGKKNKIPYWVDRDADPIRVGDEALLLAQRTQCPLVICIDRVAAVRELLRKSNCNIIISDDGLQHYRLGRSIEIAMIDGARGFGNGYLLPAGPLRESISRLKQVDLVIVNSDESSKHWMRLKGDSLVSLQNPHATQPLTNFQHKKIHAVAGIGHPERFFAMLRENKLEIIEHIFPDHYGFQPQDIDFADDLPVIMTEKDAVKCIKFAKPQHWYLPVNADVSKEVENKICSLLESNRGQYAQH
jgi:tetraacyldisaccharide 4'-kinase